MFAAWAGKISATGAVGSPAGVGSGRFFFVATAGARRATTRTADKKGRRRGLITRNGGWRWLRKAKAGRNETPSLGNSAIPANWDTESARATEIAPGRRNAEATEPKMNEL